MSACVSCGSPLSQSGATWRCTCGGAWVPETALADMVERMTPGPVVIPWEHRGGAHRACPTCAKTMEATSLASVALDRCAADGIWFDAQELQRVLQQTPHDPRRENGDDLFALLFKWLRELATRR